MSEQATSAEKASAEFVRAEIGPAERAADRSAPTLPRGQPAGSRSASSRRWRPARLIIVAFILLALAGAATFYWYGTRNLESTDDAVVDGDAAQITPRVAGMVVALHVGDNQAVKKGDLLLEIDPGDYRTAVENAKANLAAAQAQRLIAQANLDLTRASTAATLAQAMAGVEHAKAAVAQGEAQVAAAEAELSRASDDALRYEKLVKEDYASRQRYEQARAQARTADAQLRAAKEGVKVAKAQVAEAVGKLDEARTAPQQVAVREAEIRSAEAQVAAARAALDQAELNLSYTGIRAPQDGVLTRRSVREGDVVQKDQTLAALVFGQPWVTANFKETQLTRMHPGQPVKIQVDAYPDTAFAGHVDSVQRGTGARFSLLPPENATGNFVKVVQRVPVKIVFDQAPPATQPLGLGMSVVPTVDVGAK